MKTERLGRLILAWIAWYEIKHGRPPTTVGFFKSTWGERERDEYQSLQAFIKGNPELP